MTDVSKEHCRLLSTHRVFMSDDIKYKLRICQEETLRQRANGKETK